MERETLRKAMPYASESNVLKYNGVLTQAMAKHGINNAMRQAHFLSQIAWESGSLKYVEEIASGKAYDTGKLAVALGNTPEADGDGQRFKGRGLIQITGRANYRAYGASIGKDLTVDGNWELLKDPVYAADSAAWFWEKHGLNELADRDEFTKITKIINGSTATVKKRLPFLRNAKIAMGLIKV